MAKQPPAVTVPPAGEREIDGVMYVTRPMDPELLVRHVGKVPGLMASLRSGSLAIDDGLMMIVRDCFALTSADGSELRDNRWKVHFLGKPSALARVIIWMAEVHFVPFLSGGKQAFDDARGSLGASLGSPAASPE